MLKVPTKCPICGKPTYVAVVKCGGCGTTINNKFGYSVFERLDEKQAEFVLAFIECGGSIKDMEKRLGISYPTVKARLSEVQKALGVAPAKSYKLEVLEGLRDGVVSVDDAIGMIEKGE